MYDFTLSVRIPNDLTCNVRVEQPYGPAFDLEVFTPGFISAVLRPLTACCRASARVKHQTIVCRVCGTDAVLPYVRLSLLLRTDERGFDPSPDRLDELVTRAPDPLTETLYEDYLRDLIAHFAYGVARVCRAELRDARTRMPQSRNVELLEDLIRSYRDSLSS